MTPDAAAAVYYAYALGLYHRRLSEPRGIRLSPSGSPWPRELHSATTR